MSGTLGDLLVRVGAEIDGFTSAMGEVKDSLKSVESTVNETGANLQRTFDEAMQGVADRAKEAEESFAGIKAAAIQMSISGAELTEAITEPLKELAKEALTAAGNTERLEMVFGGLLGSAEAGSKMVEDLHRFASSSALGLPTIESGAQRLLAFGFAGQDVIQILKSLGLASKAVGQGDGGVETLIDQLGRINQQGQLTQRNMRALNLFGGMSALSSGMGVSQDEVAAQLKKGIPADTAISALITGFQQKFAGVADTGLKGFTSELANLKNQVELTMDDIGQALLPAGKVVLQWARDLQFAIRSIADGFKQLPAPVQGGVAALAAVAAAAGPALLFLAGIGTLLPGLARAWEVIEKLGGVFAKVGPAILKAAESIPEFVAGLGSLEGITGVAASVGEALVAAISSPIVWIPLLIAALGALVIWVTEHWAGVKAAFAQAFDGLEDIWNATLGGALTAVRNFIASWWSDVSPIWNSFKTIVGEVWDSLKDHIESVWSDLKSHVLDPMMDWLKSIPGVASGLAKLGSVGTAFHQAEADKKEGDTLSGAEKRMGIGAPDPFHKTSDFENFQAEHKTKLEQAAKDMAVLREEYDKGKVSLDQLNEATKHFNELKAEKFTGRTGSGISSTGTGKEKVDHNALDALSAAHSHQEALLAMQKASVDHAYQMSQLGTGDKVGLDESQVAQMEIEAGEKRRTALDAIALQERDSTLKELDAKLKLYRGDQDGYQKLLGEKTTAEDKYQAELQKNKDAQELIVKKANDQMTADDLRHFDEDLKAQAAHNEAVLKLEDALFQAQMKAAERKRQYEDVLAQIRLDKGEITEKQYLQIEREAMDAAYADELKDIERDRAALEKMRDELSPDEYNSRKQKIDDKQQDVTGKHQLDTLKNAMSQDQAQYNQWFKPIETSFSSGITAMIEGTKTFKQAFGDMARSILDSWIKSIVQQKVLFFAHKLQEFLFHSAVNKLKVSDDAATAAASKQISFSQHMHEVMLAAKAAAANAFKAVAGIPYIGPVLAPIAAAAAFVGVMAFSAEGGADLPNQASVVFTHPREMVLPRHLSDGIRDMIASGGVANPNRIIDVAAGGGMSSSALQALRGGVQAGAEHHWGGVNIHVTNTSNDPVSGPRIFDMFQGEMRRRNLKMA